MILVESTTLIFSPKCASLTVLSRSVSFQSLEVYYISLYFLPAHTEKQWRTERVGVTGVRTPYWQPYFFELRCSYNVLFVRLASCTWCNVLSQLLLHMAAKHLTQPFPRCTGYNFLVQKAPTMEQETLYSALKIWENRWVTVALPRIPL